MDKKQWQLAMNFPVYGEEMLGFFWNQNSESGPLEGRLEGNMLARWQTESLKESHQAHFFQLRPQFERSLAVFFSLVAEPQKYCRKNQRGWICQDPSSEASAYWEIESGEKFMARSILNDDAQLTFESFSSNSGKHDRFKIDLSPRSVGPQARSILSLELFAQSCDLL